MRHVTLPLTALLYTLAAWGDNSAPILGSILGVPASAVAVDPSGNIILAGATTSFQLPVTNGSTNPNTNFTVTTDHGQTWHTLGNLPSGIATSFAIGPASWPAVYAVGAGSIFKSHHFAHMYCVKAAFDAAGNAVAIGATEDAAFPVTPDALQPALRGPRDALVVKFDPEGKVVYASYLGGSGSDAATGVAFDTEGSIYVTGITKSKDFPTTEGAYQTRFSANCPYPTDFITVFGPGVLIPVTDNQNSFVTKLGRGGSLVFSTYLGGNCKDSIYAIAVDSGGDAWVTGNTDSNTFPQVWPVDGWKAGTSYQGFVTRFAGSGTWVWRSSYLSGIPSQALATDAAGNAYLGGGNGVVKVAPQP